MLQPQYLLHTQRVLKDQQSSIFNLQNINKL